MINTIITYDHNDTALGSYFNTSFLYIDNLKDKSSISITAINGDNCLESNINNIISPFNPSNFVFVGLSHGSEDGLSLIADDDYVSERNANLFINSFFYSTACHIGRNLSNQLLNSGCKCFIGYTNVSKAPISGKYVDLFIECELHALKNFFLTSKSIDVLFNEMISFTDDKIIDLANSGDIVEAMALIANRDYMVCLGTEVEKLTSDDFN